VQIGRIVEREIGHGHAPYDGGQVDDDAIATLPHVGQSCLGHIHEAKEKFKLLYIGIYFIFALLQQHPVEPKNFFTTMPEKFIELSLAVGEFPNPYFQNCKAYCQEEKTKFEDARLKMSQ